MITNLTWLTNEFTAGELADFRKLWPCSGIPVGVGLTVAFDASGDLTDYRWSDGADHYDADLSGALSALIDESRDVLGFR